MPSTAMFIDNTVEVKPTHILVFAKLVSDAIESLLSDKHLYQTVSIDSGPWQKSLEREAKLKRKYAPNQHVSSIVFKLHGMPWLPLVSSLPGNVKPVERVRFHMPTIKTFCSACRERWPFNPLETSLFAPEPANADLLSPIQSFYVSYQCQSCKGVPVRFLIQRKGIKLQLCGRDPMEALPNPKVLPKSVASYFGDAQIAYRAGQTLAGIFFLRTFIEQFWRKESPSVIAELTKHPRTSGEVQGKAYNSELPDDFKARFPSLPALYDRLSAAIHAANPDDELFDSTEKEILEHFEARKLFKLGKKSVQT